MCGAKKTESAIPETEDNGAKAHKSSEEISVLTILARKSCTKQPHGRPWLWEVNIRRILAF
jgi:hypothetical protein